MFSYRTRRFLGRLLRITGILAAVALVVIACWMLWLQRHILYTADGVKLDFTLSQVWPEGVEAKPLDTLPSVDIQFGEITKPTDPNLEPPEMEQISGYYVTTTELFADPDGILQKLRTLSAGTAVLLEVKDGWGDFYYSSSVGSPSNEVNLTVMDSFFEAVNRLDLHTIARVSALRDYKFGLNNTNCGLWHPGGYLWIDQEHCYWLDPTVDGTLTYLIRIAQELQGMGFDEVVYRDFYIPESENIIFSSDRNAALQQAAQSLVTACASNSFIVSFMVEGTAFQIPAENCRLYLENVAAEDVAELGQSLGISDPVKQLLFFTDSGDTRYEEACVLRPLDMAY